MISIRENTELRRFIFLCVMNGLMSFGLGFILSVSLFMSPLKLKNSKQPMNEGNVNPKSVDFDRKSKEYTESFYEYTVYGETEVHPLC